MNKVKDIKLEIPKTIAPNKKIVGFDIVKSIYRRKLVGHNYC